MFLAVMSGKKFFATLQYVCFDARIKNVFSIKIFTIFNLSLNRQKGL